MGTATAVERDPAESTASTNSCSMDNAAAQQERHRELVFQAQSGGEHYAFLKFTDIAFTWYNVPLGKVQSRADSAPRQAGKNVLVPIKPAWIPTPNGEKDKDKAEPLREGYVYLFVDGYLWRELKVGPRGYFYDINLQHYKGKEKRLATGEQDDRILLPYRVNGGEPVIQIAFSEVQWGWDYINRMGGMDPADFRVKKGEKVRLATDLGVSRQSAAEWRARRMQTVKLSGYEAGFPYEAPAGEIAGIENIDSVSTKHVSIKRHRGTNIPVVYVHDSVGVARRLAAEHQAAMIALESEFLELQGGKFKKKKGGDVEVEYTEKQSALFSIASFLSGYFYQSVTDPLPNETEEQKEARQERLELSNKYVHDRDLRQFLRQDDFQSMARMINEIRTELIAVLDDDKSPGNFVVASEDAFAKARSAPGEGHAIVADVIMLMDRHPAGSYKDVDLDPADMGKLTAEDPAPDFLMRLNNQHPDKPAHPLYAYLFPAPGKKPDDPTSFDETTPPEGSPKFNCAFYREILVAQKYRKKNQAISDPGDSEDPMEDADFGKAFSSAFKFLANTFAGFQLRALTAIAEGKQNRSALWKDFLIPKGNMLDAMARLGMLATGDAFTLKDIPPGAWATGEATEHGVIPVYGKSRLEQLKKQRTDLVNSLDDGILRKQVTTPEGKTIITRMDDVFYLHERLQTVTTAAAPKSSATPPNIRAFSISEGGILLPDGLGEVVASGTLLSPAVRNNPEFAEIVRKIENLDNSIARLEAANDTVRSRHVFASGSLIFIAGIIELWSFGETISSLERRTDISKALDISAAFIGMSALLAEMREVGLMIRGVDPSKHLQTRILRDFLRTVQFKGVRAGWERFSSQMLTMIGRIVMVGAAVLGIGLSIRDMLRASYRSDTGAMVGYGALTASAGFGLAALVTGATALGIIGLVLLFAGLGILWLFSDSEMETWLKNMPFGAVDCVRGGAYDVPEIYQSDKSRYGKGEAQPYAGWREHPEYAYYSLMDMLGHPQLEWKGAYINGDLRLEVRLPNYRLGLSALDAQLLFKRSHLFRDNEEVVLSLFSKGKKLVESGASLGGDVVDIWREASVSLLKGNSGYSIRFNSKALTPFRMKGGDFDLEFRCKVYPAGRGAKLVPGSDDTYIVPMPEFDDAGRPVKQEKWVTEDVWVG